MSQDQSIETGPSRKMSVRVADNPAEFLVGRSVRFAATLSCSAWLFEAIYLLVT